jgi:hypothetical protein
MAERMCEAFAPARDGPSVEDVLRDELQHGDSMIESVAPILRHLLTNDDHSLFSDEIVARVRGMMDHLARQLLDALIDAGSEQGSRDHGTEVIAQVMAELVERSALLTHAHALAIEFSLTERLHARLSLDPVLSPLLQSLIASSETGVSAAGMALLAAQARFVQAQRRMQLPLTELPADLFFAALQALRGVEAEPAATAMAETMFRAQYDEGRSRLGLLSRLVLGMGGGATAALSVTHAGTALFLTALSLGSGQDRDLTVLATNEAQLARLALALRAAGLRPDAIEEQFLSLHPDVSMPEGFSQLGADRAAALLARSFVVPGH